VRGIGSRRFIGDLCTGIGLPLRTVPSHFPGVCVSGTSGGQAVAPNPPPHTGAVFGGGPNQLPTVNGIPCTPEHLGTCIGLAESQG